MSWRTNQITHRNVPSDAVICAIALEEDLYIDEWIKYHLALGFAHIYIYDNGETLQDKKSDRVTIITFPGQTKQLEAYRIFALQYKYKHMWCAFIDIDEFIVLKNNIMQFLNQYKDCAGIGLNWLMFGTSNKKEYSAEPVTSRFRYCSHNIHIKSIIQLKYIKSFATPHYAVLEGLTYDTNRNIITNSFNPNGDTSIACIHHYYTKSEEEFEKKINRGRADIIQKRSMDELIDIHSKNNDVYNSDAWDFYSNIKV